MRPLCAGVSGDGNPVGWVERSDTHQGRWVERWVSLRSTHPTTDAHSRSRGADSARGLLEILPLSKIEGAGKTGCALHPRSRVQSAQRTRTRAYRFSGEHPAFPAQWLYGLLRALPGERLFCHRRQRDTALDPIGSMRNRQLDASTAASGPHDFAVRVMRVRLCAFRVHRIPPHVRDDREPPLIG